MNSRKEHEKNNSSVTTKDLVHDENAGDAFKNARPAFQTCLQRIITLVDKMLKCHRLERDRFKDAMTCKKKIQQVNDYEKAASDVNVSCAAMHMRETLASFFSFDEIWNDVQQDAHLKKKEKEMLLACHEATIDNVKEIDELRRKGKCAAQKGHNACQNMFELFKKTLEQNGF